MRRARLTVRGRALRCAMAAEFVTRLAIVWRAILPGFAIAFFVVAVIARPASQARDGARLLDPDRPEFQDEAPPVSRIRLETSKRPITLEMQRAWLHTAPIDSTHSSARGSTTTPASSGSGPDSGRST